MGKGLCIRLLGPMRVLLDEAPLPPLRSRKALSLLALLTLRNGRPAARGWLATTLWPDAELSTALSSLRPVVSELRKALGPAGRRLGSGDRHSIAFEVDGLSVDALEFDRAIETRDFASAVERYSGPLLEGVEEEWAFQERRVRHDAFLSALMRLGEAAIEEREHEEAIRLFRRAVGADPFRDSARRGAMRAYENSGDVNAALQEYREYAQLLGGEFGTAPEDETAALYNRLRQEVRRPAQPTSIQEGAPSPQVGHIPSPLTALIGRDDERLDVAGLLRRSRLVTLTGFGGIGKTRLALAVAADSAKEYADGVWFVRLEELAEGSLLARQIGDVLGLREIPRESWQTSLKEHLRDKKALLILDNCEHLQAPCAELTLRLLTDCPNLKVLTTGRQALGIVGETAWVVPPLAVPDPGGLPEGRATLQRVAMGYEGVRLFAERAEAVATGFALTAANARTVAEICYRLEGIPLALELAAARVKALTVEQVLQRLRARLDLSSVNRLAPSRQQTLRSTLEWSHDLLSESESVLFRRLSIFLAGWTIDAAARLFDEDKDRDRVFDLVSSLVDRSLIGFEAQEGRYRWSEIVRQFAEEKLRQADEEESIRDRHLDWCVALVEEAEPELRGAAQREWLQRLEEEMPNLRSAIEWSAAKGDGCEAELRLVGALSMFWYIRGEFREGRTRLASALERAGAERRTLARAKALYGRGILAYSQSDYDEARASHEESLSIRQALGDPRGTAESLLNLGNIAHATSDHILAETYFQRALEINLEIDNRQGAALASSNLGAVKLALGQNRAARSRLERSVEMWRQIGNHGYMAWDLSNLSSLAYERGDYLAAQAYLNECWTIFEGMANRIGLAWTLYKLAKVESDQGRFDSAQPLLERSLAIFDDMGDRNGRGWCLEEMSQAARGSGDLSTAWFCLDEATELFRDIKDRQAVAHMTQKRAVLHRLEGDVQAAELCNREALRSFMAAGERRGIMRVLQEHAMIAARQGLYETAVVAWGASDAIRDTHDLIVTPSETSIYAPLLDAARASLGNFAFGIAFDKGRAMEPQEAVGVLIEVGGSV